MVALPGPFANACLMQAFEEELATLKEKLLVMASHAEAGVRNAVVDQVTGIIRDEIGKLRAHGVTAEELKETFN